MRTRHACWRDRHRVRHAHARERALGEIAAARELLLADRDRTGSCTRAGSATTVTGEACTAAPSAGLAKCVMPLKIGKYVSAASKQPARTIFLRPILSDKRAEHDEERRGDNQCRSHHELRARRIDLQRLLEEQQSVELAAIPYDGLAGGGPEQGQQHDLEIPPLCERLGQRRLRQLARGFHLLEYRRFLQLQPDVHGDHEQDGRQQERHAPALVFEVPVGHERAARENDEQREEEAQRGRCLDPARVEAAPAGWRVLGDVRRGPAVLTAEREALQQSKCDEEDRRGDANRLVRRQAADERGRGAHDDDGDEEGVLAADEVTEPAEHQRTERPHEEPGRESQQREQERGGVVHPREELLGDDGDQRAVEVEVVPLEDGAER